MKKALFATAILMSSVFAAPTVAAQDTPSYSNTLESTPAPVEKTDVNAKETSVTRIVQQPTDESTNMAFLLVGGGIAALAVAGLYASSRR